MRWPMGWRRMASLSISSTRIGKAVTAHAMPTPRTNCHGIACAPTQPALPSRPMPATQPNTSGTPSASVAVIVLSRRCCQAAFRSSSIPASMTNTITAHHAIPFKAPMTAGLNTKL
jgi:hypothetical protein